MCFSDFPRNKTDLEEQSLDDLFNSLKIYEAEVKSSSSASTSTKNIAFVSSSNTDSTNEPISAIASVSAVSAKIPVSALPNVDTLSNAVIYLFFASQSTSPQLDNDDLKQIDADDLEEMDLKWKMAMLTVRARWSATTATGKDTLQGSVGLLRIQEGMAEEEPTNYALLAFTSSSSSSSDNELRDNALVVPRQKFKTSEQERDDLKLKLEMFQTSSKNLSQLLASQTNDKIRLGYNTQVFTRFMFDCDELFTSESDESLPFSPIYDRYQSGDGYHAVPPPYIGTFMPPKPDLVFHNAPSVNETIHTTFNVELSPTKPDKDLSPTHRPLASIIEDWVSDLEDDSEAKIPQNAPSFVQPNEQVKTPRNRKACFACKSLTHLIKDCDFYEKQMAQTPARNHAQRGNHQQYARMTLLNPQRHVVPIAVLTKSKLVPITAARPVTTAAPPKPHVTRPRYAKIVVTKPHSPPKRHINRSPPLKLVIFLKKELLLRLLWLMLLRVFRKNRNGNLNVQS
uniref:Uncharacterized protein n=1 Tax=Tanacetum cinerariifolium TaxID=118510 RepID=A0A699KG60_TANCI|nr:hypothetical protein [Tanacetum cinerariifolium]